jgi:hypothetical protein
MGVGTWASWAGSPGVTSAMGEQWGRGCEAGKGHMQER